MGTDHDRDAELTCRELVEQVTDYLEGALDGPARARFEAHLAACQGCEDHLDQVRRTVALLGLSGAPRVDPADAGRLLALFRSLRDGAGAPPET